MGTPTAAAGISDHANPLLALPFQPAIEALGPDDWDGVEAAAFPRTQLRFRNDDVLRQWLAVTSPAVRTGPSPGPDAAE